MEPTKSAAATPISGTTLLRILQGVAVATKSAENVPRQILQRLCPGPAADPGDGVILPFGKWRTAIATRIPDEDTAQIANLGLAVAYLRGLYKSEGGDPCEAVGEADLALIWALVRGALTSKLLTRPLCTASRSAQGFLSVALCSLVNNGNIDELFRLHVWLPDGQRGNPEVAVHSHQAGAQSWILAGEGTDHSYKVEHAEDFGVATHAEYALAWSDGKVLGTQYKTNQAYSTISNTKKLVRVVPLESNVHRRGTSYRISAAQYHSSEVAPDRFHATLFVFDSQLGFVQDAGVLGPKDGDSFTQLRDPAGVTPENLASMVDAVRSWETFMDEGQKHIYNAEWEHALRAFSNALSLCSHRDGFPNKAYHRKLVLYKIARVNRCLGRYERSRSILEGVIKDMDVNKLRMDCVGELGVVYRHLNLLTDAMHMFEVQYNTAKQLGFEAETCRAIGNLGIVNYQISQRDRDNTVLDLAITQLQERVKRARDLQKSLSIHDPGAINDGKNWEIIGLSRLSLCLAARGNVEEAIATAQQALALVSGFGDSTVVALTRFFYGHALLLGGRRREAMEQFNTRAGCTPAIALCKEPSKEHLEYLRELVDAGVNLDRVDEQGYTALDYAVFSGNIEFEGVVLDGLRQRAGAREIEEQLTGAKLRKSYRKLFQEVLRPILIERCGDDCMQRLRSAYAKSLSSEKETRAMFSGFSYVPYSKFRSLGRLPRYTDGLGKTFTDSSSSRSHENLDFVIFFSYRWRGAGKPDDESNTQYNRMLNAIERFLILHNSVNRERLGIWVDFACINQEDPMPGVHALPMILTQCNAVISLVDDHYNDRAWCSVEILLIQTLKKSYGLHMWYEQAYVPSEKIHNDQAGSWILREGPMGLEISTSGKLLSFEEIDRPKVTFLERQSRLLG